MWTQNAKTRRASHSLFLLRKRPWGEVQQADRYDISIAQGPAPETSDIVNLGGYDAAEFRELHKNLLIVAADAKAAKAKALTHVNGWFQPA
jgi:hypothetical protein